MRAPVETEPSTFIGAVIHSETQRGVRYHIERIVGQGGMGTAYFAHRESELGSSPVVVKIMKVGPGMAEIAPDIVAMKESVALRRLNDTLPPSPFVVRFVDSGSLDAGSSARIPWTAIEYVHGGIEGTTLEDRVTYAVHKTGYAFEPARAAHAIRCLSAGLRDIHGVGVIHRDVTPGNVLCCGFGEREIFKIADFGVARASGLQLTFEGLCAGTVGYSAPEAAGVSAGPPTDVFGFAAVVYYLLTGQRYFAADSPVEALHLILSPSRPRIADHPTLSPELAHQTDACNAIDSALAQATLLDPKKRPESPERLAAELLTCLGAQNSGPRSSRQLLNALQSSRSHYASHRFVARQRPRSDLAVLSAAWDVDGHALALLVNGGCFWNGDTWLDAAPLLSKLPGRLQFTQLHEAGGWLVGGDALSVIDARGVRESLGPPTAGATFLLARGRLDDILLAVARDAVGNLALMPMVARRFLRPIPLPPDTHVSNLQRLGDSRFVVAGRCNGKGFAAVVSPLDGEIRELATPDVRSFIGGAPVPEQPAALITASAGLVMRVEGDVVTSTRVPGEPDVSAVAVDVFGREWASSLGTLWTRDASEAATWSIAWQDPRWTAPFISLLAQPGLVLAMTADGGIIEGRSNT